MIARRDALAFGLAAVVLVAACKRHEHRDQGGRGERTNATTDGASPLGPAALDATSADAGDASADAIVNRDAASYSGALYRSPNGGFAIRFPEGKAPEVEEKTITSGRAAVHLFKVQYGTSGYIVSYDDFAKGSGRAPELVLDGAREGVVGTTGGTIESERPITLDGYPGLDLAVTATTSGITMRQRARIFLVDGRLYQLIVVAPSWSGAMAVEQEFFDSFRLLSDGGLP